MVQILAAAVCENHSFADVGFDLVHREAPFMLQMILDSAEAEVSGVFCISPTGVEPPSVLNGRLSAHTASFFLAIQQVFPAKNDLSDRKPAPSKLLSTFQRGMFAVFWMQRTKPC